MKKNSIIFLLLMLSMLGFAQQDNNAPFDPATRKGVLPNGLTYYIKQNKEPKELVSFHFAQKVGSILENESQRGLAHFLEHMAFNGLEHFKGKAALKYLEKNGMAFGSEINAYTSFDKTVYNIDNVPVHNASLLDSVLLVLHDWSGYISLEEKEIDAERGVVNEEWRTRNTATKRAINKLLKEGLFRGSLYAERQPIGLMSVINYFKYDALRDYYKTWYRPDFQGVVVVGDIDVNDMEKRIVKIFSSIPLRKNLPQQPPIAYPQPSDSLWFVEALDKELQTESVNLVFRSPASTLEGKAFLRKTLIQQLATSILNKRLAEFVQKDPACPVLRSDFSIYKIAKPFDFAELSVGKAKEGKMLDAFEFVAREFYRYLKYGATESELAREKLENKNGLIAYLKNKDKIANGTYIASILSHFLDNAPHTDVAWEVDYNLKTLETITNQDILECVNKMCGTRDRFIYVMGSEKKSYCSKDVLEGVLNKVKNEALLPYEEKADHRPLIADSLVIKPLKGKFAVKGFDKAHGYILANDVKIIIFPTPYDKDRVFLQGYSKGGESLLSASLLPSEQITMGVVARSGLGEFTQVELEKKLAGTHAGINFSIGELSENISGSSTKTDVEVLLQRLYLGFAKPRFDKNIFDLDIKNRRINLEKKKNDKKNIFYDSLYLASVNHHQRRFIVDEKIIDKMNLSDVEKIYKDRFGNIADFTFLFVGDIDEAALLQLAQKYIGTIPSKPTRENYIDHNYEPPFGKTPVHMGIEMETPQTTVNISMSTPLPYYNAKNALLMDVIGKLLSKSYLESIREKEGGTYGVGASGGAYKEPKPHARIMVRFNCNPEKTDKLVSIVYEAIDKLKTEVDADDLKEIKESFTKQAKESVNNNDYWISSLVNQEFQKNPYIPLDQYLKMISAITQKDINDLMKTFTKKTRIIEGIMTPAKK